MAMTAFTYDMNIIAKLDDEPNDVGGLTAAQLKAKFDEGGLALKEYVNDTLIPEIEQEIADTMADAVIGQVPGMTVVIPLGEEIPTEERILGAVYWQVVSAY